MSVGVSNVQGDGGWGMGAGGPHAKERVAVVN